MPSFADHFSTVAASYAAYRPHYPEPLFAWLSRVAPDRERAWDCGTGSGQAAERLANDFGEVIATDPSVAQLASAPATPGVSYVTMTAEAAALADRTVALVTVAQALHWFDHAAFFREAHRVLRPGGILAIWSYALARIDPAIDAILGSFYGGTVGPYWPSERALVDSGYAGIDLPYPEISHPSFAMEAQWNLPQLEGYVSTWSAVTRYRKARGEDPLPALAHSLREVWGAPLATRVIRWPLTLRAARKQ